MSTGDGSGEQSNVSFSIMEKKNCRLFVASSAEKTADTAPLQKPRQNVKNTQSKVDQGSSHAFLKLA